MICCMAGEHMICCQVVKNIKYGLDMLQLENILCVVAGGHMAYDMLQVENISFVFVAA